MTTLRRNLFRLWVLASTLWLAFILWNVTKKGALHGNLPDTFIVAIVPPCIVFAVGLTWIWLRFGEAHWRRLLPDHLRKGLARLYIAVSVPWAAWFGYQVLDALDRRRPASAAFWSLLIVPVGGPLLLL